MLIAFDVRVKALRVNNNLGAFRTKVFQKLRPYNNVAVKASIWL